MDIKQEKYTVLVVDDEESILDVTEGFFQRKGHEVFTAANGEEALEVINAEKIDCCFTDINMPKMNGLELADQLQKRDHTFPVVIMTGYPSIENTIDTLKNGVVDFLIKPINLEQMELTLLRVVKQRSLFVENLI
ncbi:MAG: sigma-54-dependent Fis family transcriptional regulator, partial [Desulfobacula sp.]|nr:sigma-54-dependent Fis family transcriptional regulator [Desulfobacula sp.]